VHWELGFRACHAFPSQTDSVTDWHLSNVKVK